MILAQTYLCILHELGNQCHKHHMPDFPLADYAAQHWADHARFGNVSLSIQDGIERLFNPDKPQFAAWVWIYDIDGPTKKQAGLYPRRPEATSLYCTALCGRLSSSAEHLINRHPRDIHARCGFYTTPLHAALIKGHLQVARLLLHSGADANSRRVPLKLASQFGHLDIVRLLLDCGANVDAQDRTSRPLRS